MERKTNNFAIRSATAHDCEGILRCLALAFAPYREAYTPEAFLDTVLTPETVQTRMAEMSLFVAAAESGDVAGTIACKVMGGGRGHLRGMAVRPEWHGTGLSGRLIDAAEQYLRESGCKTITLNTTEPLTRATRFYEKRGYRPTGKFGQFFGMSLFEYSKSL